MNQTTAIVINGASGRMGQALLRASQERPEITISGALVRADSILVGTPTSSMPTHIAPTITYTASINPHTKVDTLIDFSTPQGFEVALAIAIQRRMAFVSGTTGLQTHHYQALERAAEIIPVLWSANFSLGIALLTRLAREAAQQLRDWDCEILEMHHRHKEDAPSGTALSLGQAITDSREARFDEAAVFTRVGNVGQRPASTIGFAVMRGGDSVGEHTVLFASEGERIELTHRATNRDIFARGALTAAVWLSERTPGCYDLHDVLTG